LYYSITDFKLIVVNLNSRHIN